MNLNKQYDRDKAKHFIEGRHFVLHCHHYNTQLHRAIINTPFMDGPDFVFRVSRDDFYDTIGAVLKSKQITGADRVKEACNDLYRYMGFGFFDMAGLGPKGGTVTALHSHLATGYINKWGAQDKPVDDVGRGFLAAAWALAYGGNPKKCVVRQTRCIAQGHKTCEFTVEV